MPGFGSHPRLKLIPSLNRGCEIIDPRLQKNVKYKKRESEQSASGFGRRDRATSFRSLIKLNATLAHCAQSFTSNLYNLEVRCHQWKCISRPENLIAESFRNWISLIKYYTNWSKSWLLNRYYHSCQKESTAIRKSGLSKQYFTAPAISDIPFPIIIFIPIVLKDQRWEKSETYNLETKTRNKLLAERNLKAQCGFSVRKLHYSKTCFHLEYHQANCDFDKPLSISFKLRRAKIWDNGEDRY